MSNLHHGAAIKNDLIYAAAFFLASNSYFLVYELLKDQKSERDKI